MQDTYRCISEICFVNVKLSMKINRDNQQPKKKKQKLFQRPCFTAFKLLKNISHKIMAWYDVINNRKVSILSL